MFEFISAAFCFAVFGGVTGLTVWDIVVVPMLPHLEMLQRKFRRKK